MRRSLSIGFLFLLLSVHSACTLQPPSVELPTQPAVLNITPAPTLDIDATATVLAIELRPTATPAGLYIVQSGDTLGTIANRYGTTVEDLMAMNGLSNADMLSVGQELIIPSLVDDTPEIVIPTELPTATLTPTLVITLTTP